MTEQNYNRLMERVLDLQRRVKAVNLNYKGCLKWWLDGLTGKGWDIHITE